MLFSDAIWRRAARTSCCASSSSCKTIRLHLPTTQPLCNQLIGKNCVNCVHYVHVRSCASPALSHFTGPQKIFQIHRSSPGIQPSAAWPKRLLEYGRARWVWNVEWKILFASTVGGNLLRRKKRSVSIFFSCVMSRQMANGIVVTFFLITLRFEIGCHRSLLNYF